MEDKLGTLSNLLVDLFGIFLNPFSPLFVFSPVFAFNPVFVFGPVFVFSPFRKSFLFELNLLF